MKYKKKPVVIEAWQVGSDEPQPYWLEHALNTNLGDNDVQRLEDGYMIVTLEGEMKADMGDYIIQGVQGELYPCKPHIFNATYDPVPTEDQEG